MNSLPTPRRSASGFDLGPPTDILRAKLEGGLKPAEAEVLLRHGTEAAFCGGLLENKADGVYCCRLCGLPLFRAATKFDSGTGWPSFFAPYDPQHLVKVTDRSYGMIRVEIRCARCGSHQGHVFPDGPPPTRERYCINSVSLSFVRAGDPFPDPMDRGDARVGSRDA